MPYESGFEGTLEPYMVISENFIYVPGWDYQVPWLYAILLYIYIYIL